MSEPTSMPLPGAAKMAECCGNCDAFLPMQNNPKIGRCIASPPQPVVTRYEAMAVPTPEGMPPLTQMYAKVIDGAFPLTAAHLRCRDGYRPKLSIPDLKIETVTEGGEQ